MDQMFVTWILTMLIMVVISYADGKGTNHKKAIIISNKLFKTGEVFNIGSFAILLIINMLYALFW